MNANLNRQYRLFLTLSLFYTFLNFFPFMASSYPSVMGTGFEVFAKIILFALLIPFTVFLMGKESQMGDLVNFGIAFLLVFPFSYFLNNVLQYLSMDFPFLRFLLISILFALFLLGRSKRA